MRNQLLNQKIAALFALVTLFIFSTVAVARPSFDEKAITDVGWEVVFIESVYDAENDTTTFYYRLYASDWEKDLSHWVLAIESEEVPIASGTNTSFGLDPTTGIYGVKWDNGQLSGTDEIYSITVNGKIDETTTHYSVKGGTYFAIGETVGPGESITVGEDTFSISGVVYVDANMNGVFDTDEPRLANVSVDLFDADDQLITTVLTDADGGYLFENMSQDYYAVNVSGNNDVDDFNDLLERYFNRLDSQPIYVSLFGVDSMDNDFGFDINTVAIIDDLHPDDLDGNGIVLSGTGKTIGFWKHQNSVAIKGKGRAQVDSATLLGYLNAIEGLYLADPFQFADGDEFQDAFDIMKMTSSDSVDLLSKQLLGTELNHVSGKGLVGETNQLQGVIIAWSEYLVKFSVYFDRDTLLNAKDICDMINNTGE